MELPRYEGPHAVPALPRGRCPELLALTLDSSPVEVADMHAEPAGVCLKVGVRTSLCRERQLSVGRLAARDGRKALLPLTLDGIGVKLGDRDAGPPGICL
jgi:hypothetical protein